MNRIIENIFRHKKANFEKLSAYGFKCDGDFFTYLADFADGQMRLNIAVDKSGEISTEVTDLETDEPFTLFLVEGAAGEFIGGVRTEYEAILTDVADKCFEREVFKSAQAKEIIEYVRKTYGDELEYLWDKFPDNAICRRKDNQKWYLAILTVSRRKLGMNSDETVEVADLRMDPENIEKTVDNATYYRGYHMNKKHWITICLDNSLSSEEIFKRIDESYVLARK